MLDWQEHYDDNNTTGIGKLLSGNEAWQITFWYNDDTYYCYIYADSFDEALGMFFRVHHNISYDDIIAHEEV